MHEEFQKPVSHEPLLTTEERRTMSDANRKKSHNSKTQKKKAEKQQASADAQDKLLREEQAKLARKSRHARSAENREKAARKLTKKATSENKTVAENEPRKQITPPAVQNPPNQPEPIKEPDTAKKPQLTTAKVNRYQNSKRAIRARRRASSIKAGILGFFATFLIGMVIFGRVKVNELYTEITKQQKIYEDTVAKNVSMRSEMEGKMTVKNVAEYAENTLGLKPLNRSQIEYIRLQTEDETTIAEEETGLLARIRAHFAKVWAFIKGE